MKKALALLLALCMMLCMFTACASKTDDSVKEDTSSANTAADTKTDDTAAADDTADTAEDNTADADVAENIKIGVSVADLSNPFYVDITDGMKSAAKEGDELLIVDAGFDAAKQISDIEDMIQQGVSVICIDPVDSASIKSSLEACKNAGIPAVAYNSPVDDADMVSCTVVTDNYMAGQLIGTALAEQMGGEGKVAMLTYDVALVCYDRAEGFLDSINQYPGIEVVVRQEITPGTDTALPVMENILQTYPDLSGVFCLNDPSALGALAAIEAAGLLDQVKVVAVDGSDDGKASIAAGKLLATAAQRPVDIGAYTIEACYKLLAGESVETNITVPTELVDASNCQ